MKIAFVRPTLGAKHHHPYHSRAMMEPLAFAILAGMTPTDVELHLYDERIERVPVEEKFDLAAISVETYSARRAYQLSRDFHANGTPVILGGFHPTLVPDEASEHADSIAIGPVENIWLQIVEDARMGNLQQRYVPTQQQTLAGLQIDRTIFKGKPYLPIAMLQFTRGCVRDCDFCSVRQFYRGEMLHRPVGEVVAEISQLKTRTVFFVDDNISVDREAARELFTALIPLCIRWISQAELDVANDPELLDLMAKSGCIALIVGMESLNERNLNQMNKGWASPSGYANSLAALRSHGIMVYGAFVFGYDEDTPESFDRTCDFALENKLFIANFNMLQPYPGTPLYDRLRQENRLLYDRWWLDPEYRWDKAAFRPLGMTPQELEEGCMRARHRFASFGSILHRALDFQAHLKDPYRAMMFFAANLISKQDISRKKGLPLGYAEDLPRNEVTM